MINISSIFKKLFNNNLGIILAYIILALFFTFPLIFNITDSMSSGNDLIENEYTINSDPIYFMWNFWLFKHNLIDLKISPFSHTDMIFYPNGFDINSAGNDNLLNSVLSIPLQLISNNLILIYNIIIIFNFVFAAFASYLLIKYLISDRKISFLGGIIFGFSPYMIARSMEHFSLITAGVIPLFILMFLIMLKNPSAKNALLAAIAFSLSCFGAWQYGLFNIIFIFCSLAYFTFCRKEQILNKKYFKNFLIFIALSFIILFPIVFPMAQGYLNRNMIPPPFSDTVLYSASILSYFIPPPLSNFFGDFINPELFKSFSLYMVESVNYLGLLEIAIIIFYIINRKKLEPKISYWLYLLIIFFVLSLGPFLKLALPSLIFDKIPLPYYFIFKYVPFFNFARETSRLSIFVMLFTAIIFAFALKYILSRNNSNSRARITILAVFTAIIIIERITLPYPIEKIKIPDFYKNIAQDKETYAILDLPIDMKQKFSLYNLYQTVHEKKITSGDIMPNAFTPHVYAYLKKNDFLKNSSCAPESDPWGNTFEKNIDKEKTIKDFKNINIKYIIIHKDIIRRIDVDYDSSGQKKYDCQALKDDIRELFGNDIPAYEDELIKAYLITQT